MYNENLIKFHIFYFFVKIGNLKKENLALHTLFDKSEEKFKISEMEKSRISKIFTDFSEGILVVDENEKEIKRLTGFAQEKALLEWLSQ